ALAAGSGAPGTITYTYFQQASAPSTCTSGGTTIGTATVSGNNTYTPSAGFTPTVAGNYWLYASYNGDTNNNAATSTCPPGTSQKIRSEERRVGKEATAPASATPENEKDATTITANLAP